MGKKKAPLSWEPERRGNIYCSPACGHGCTFEEHQTAVQQAARLITRLAGGCKSWAPQVWENMGWHYAAVSFSGHLKVYPSEDDYMAFLSMDPDSHGGNWVKHGKTPMEAVERVIVKAQKYRNEIQRAIDGAQKDIGREDGG